MMLLSTRLGLFLVLFLALFSAHGASVPKLNITWNCGSCTHNEKIIPLIKQAYNNEAQNSGRSVSAKEIAQVEIIEFRQRNPGVRVMFGVMAGKDRLGLRISYKGNEYYTSDYSANVVQGMNHLCSAVASETYQKLDSAAQ
ncbi:MAG: hypothetical protein ABW139_02245 [Candidatus Thiodiazotropha sp. DIVDIV]